MTQRQEASTATQPAPVLLLSYRGVDRVACVGEMPTAAAAAAAALLLVGRSLGLPQNATFYVPLMAPLSSFSPSPPPAYLCPDDTAAQWPDPLHPVPAERGPRRDGRTRTSPHAPEAHYLEDERNGRRTMRMGHLKPRMSSLVGGSDVEQGRAKATSLKLEKEVVEIGKVFQG